VPIFHLALYSRSDGEVHVTVAPVCQFGTQLSWRMTLRETEEFAESVRNRS